MAVADGPVSERVPVGLFPQALMFPDSVSDGLTHGLQRTTVSLIIKLVGRAMKAPIEPTGRCRYRTLPILVGWDGLTGVHTHLPLPFKEPTRHTVAAANRPGMKSIIVSRWRSLFV